MQLRLLDILADPDNPEIWPLKIKILKSEKRERKKYPLPHQETGLYCKFYCAKNQAYLVDNPLQDNEKTKSENQIKEIAKLEDCRSCFELEIIDAIIYHNNGEALKFFIVDREIPVMYPNDLRDKKQEESFFKRYPDALEKLE